MSGASEQECKAVIEGKKTRPTRRLVLPRYLKRGAAVHIALDRMTNWQRHQWERAGADPDRAAEFARMERPMK